MVSGKPDTQIVRSKVMDAIHLFSDVKKAAACGQRYGGIHMNWTRYMKAVTCGSCKRTLLYRFNLKQYERLWDGYEAFCSAAYRFVNSRVLHRDYADYLMERVYQNMVKTQKAYGY